MQVDDQGGNSIAACAASRGKCRRPLCGIPAVWLGSRCQPLHIDWRNHITTIASMSLHVGSLLTQWPLHEWSGADLCGRLLFNDESAILLANHRKLECGGSSIFFGSPALVLRWLATSPGGFLTTAGCRGER